jgi:hypothetical protein
MNENQSDFKKKRGKKREKNNKIRVINFGMIRRQLDKLEKNGRVLETIKID